MRTRMVIFALLMRVGAGVGFANEPSTPETRSQIEARLNSDAKSFGVSVADLVRLRQFGYSDAEIHAQITENGRTARQLITEREVVDELAKALVEVNQRIVKLSPEKQESEREKAIKSAVAKIRRERRASRQELRLILTRTSFLRDDEINRVAR